MMQPTFRPIGWWLKRADAQIDRAFADAVGGQGLDRREWQVLESLSQAPLGEAELLAALEPFDGAAAAVQNLRASGFIGPAGGAAVLPDAGGALQLTESGVAAHRRAAAAAAGVRARVGAALPGEKYSTLVALLSDLVDGLQPRSDKWWRSAVIYQIYPRSFADSNGDGIGDLEGVRSRLGYLAELGVDAIWLSPFYSSPQADAGYDVSDYRDVDPVFGSLADAKALIAEAHQHQLRIIVDLVPNHTSDRHLWFQAALAAGPGSQERARYLFREGRGPNGAEPPNNWVSNFGGPAWTRVADGQWYLHLFTPEQPDLDWTNQEVVQEFKDILRFWLELGVDGFRIDVAHGLAKDPDLTDLSTGAEGHLLTLAQSGEHPHWDRDEVHEVYRGWRQVVDEYAGDRVFVAEAWVPNPDRFARYLRPDELHTAFNFNFLDAPWDPDVVRQVIDQTLTEIREVGAPATWVLSNHDVIRHPTRFGGGELGARRARAGTMLMLALPGGAYIYQGEELGLEEVFEIPAELRQDPIFFRTQGERLGRDGCRVPLPWSGEAPPFGFGPGGTPWLPQPAKWVALTVEHQDGDPASTLTLYRNALRARRANPALGDGPMRWLAAPDGLLAFERGADFVCVVNYGDSAAELPSEVQGGTLVLASTADAVPTATDGKSIAAASAAWFDTRPTPT